MTDGDALLTAIIAQPDEDTPRLMYADWLNEQGGPENAARAEFIRVQIELARSPFRCADGPGPWCRCPCCRLARRERELVQEHGPRWQQQALGQPGGARQLDPRTSVTFARGFAEALAATTNDLVRHAGDFFCKSPLRAVSLFGQRPEASRHAGVFGGQPFAWLDFGRWSPSVEWSEHYLPRPLFVRLPRVLRRDYWHLRFYPTEAAAIEALSTACVKYGREKADALASRTAVV